MFRVGGSSPQVGPVSRAQLLASNVVERLHDAIYVIPRQADEESLNRQPLNLKEYAVDLAYCIKELQRVADEFPRMTAEELPAALAEVAEEERRVDEEMEALLEDAKTLRDRLDGRCLVCVAELIRE